MPSCWDEMVSAAFRGLTGRYRLTNEDRALQAEDQLDKLLQQLDRRGETLEMACETLRKEVLTTRRDRPRCRAKLSDCKRARSQLDRLISYKEMVLQHVDALRCTELNKSLISTLQESSRTLKELGVMDGVRQAEMVVNDVESSMQQVHELSSVLSAPMLSNGLGPSFMGMSSEADQELERELESLFGEEPVAVSAEDNRPSPAIPDALHSIESCSEIGARAHIEKFSQ